MAQARTDSQPAGSARGGLGAVVARNAAFTVAARLAFLVAWAAITPYMLRTLGEERFALWALFFALSGYFANFDLGLSHALIRFVAEFTASRDDRALRGVVSLATVLYLCLTIPVIVALAVFREPLLDLIHTPLPLRAEAAWCLVGMGVVLGLQNLAGVLNSILTGRQRMDVSNSIQLVVTAIQIAGALFALHLGWGLRGLVLTYGAGVLLFGAGLLLAVRAIAPELRFDPGAMRRDLLQRLFGFSFALQVVLLGNFLQVQLDKFLLANLVTLAVVARWELAARLAFAAWAIPLLVLPPLVPAVAHLGTLAEHDRVVRLYRRGSHYLAAGAFPIAAFTIAAAPALVTAWLGPGYRDVARTTAGLVAFLLVTILTGVGTAVVRGLDRPWIEARYHVVGTVIHLALSLVLVPRFGIDGAVVALMVSGLIAVAYFMWAFHRFIGERFLPWLRDVALAPAAISAVAAAATLLLRGGPWVASPAGRSEAWVQVAACAAIFLVVVGGGYLALRVVPLAELRELFGGRFAERSVAPPPQT